MAKPVTHDAFALTTWRGIEDRLRKPRVAYSEALKPFDPSWRKAARTEKETERLEELPALRVAYTEEYTDVVRGLVAGVPLPGTVSASFIALERRTRAKAVMSPKDTLVSSLFPPQALAVPFGIMVGFAIAEETPDTLRDNTGQFVSFTFLGIQVARGLTSVIASRLAVQRVERMPFTDPTQPAVANTLKILSQEEDIYTSLMVSRETWLARSIPVTAAAGVVGSAFVA